MLTTLLQGVDLVNAVTTIRINRQVIDTMRQLVEVISDIVQYMAQRIAPLTIQALAAARVFAENAGPVLTVIRSAVDAVNAVQTVVIVDVAAKMQYIAERIIGMVFHLSRVASWMSVEARAAAAAFATAVGPVVSVIHTAADAVNSVQTIVVMDVRARMAYIAERIIGMVFHLNRVAGWMSVEARTAAAAFATAVGPVVSVIKSAVETINDVQKVEIIDVRERMAYIAERIVGMVFHLNRVASWIGEEARGAAAAFAAAVGPVIEVIKAAVETITAVQGIKPEPGLGNVLAYISESIVAMVGMLRDVRSIVGDITTGLREFGERLQTILETIQGVAETLKAVAELEVPAAVETVAKLWEQLRGILDLIYQGLLWNIARFDVDTLVSGAFAMGASWVKGLVAGIESQLPNLIAVLQYIRDLFPHSPAKVGPLRQAPDWSGYMLSGLDRAGETLARRLGAAMPGGALVPAGAGGATGARSRGGNSVTININNPRGEPSERSLRRELALISALGVGL
jgi:primosomal protein N''